MAKKQPIKPPTVCHYCDTVFPEQDLIPAGEDDIVFCDGCWNMINT